MSLLLFRSGRAPVISIVPGLGLLSGLMVLGLLSASGAELRHSEGHGQAVQEDTTFSASLAEPDDALLSTNFLNLDRKPKALPVRDLRRLIGTARKLRRAENYAGAAKMLVTILEEEPPLEFKRAVLFELALVAQDEKLLSRAQQILAQYLKLFPEDPTVPEVLLRQGLIFRQMGAFQLALAKYYAVMNSALTLKLDQFDYYKRLVLQAQTEIADTYYLQGKFPEAVDFFRRILKQDSLELNRTQIQFKLIRSLWSQGKHADVVTECAKFLEKFPGAGEVPEVRFLCANSFKGLGRSSDALAQVLKLLESQQGAARTDPDTWVYWQQRAGNEIANQLYLEGDYLHALQVYQHLASLDLSVTWQLPVQYQIGLIHERLRQPQNASEVYAAIQKREPELAGVAEVASLRTVVEMAKWRKEHLDWRSRAELAVQNLHLPPALLSPPGVSSKDVAPKPKT